MSKVIVDTLENTAGTFTSAIDSLGPSTTLAAVGTYLFSQYRGSPGFAQGDVVSAATYPLRPTNAFGNTSGTNISSGSWRCMGFKADSFTNEEASTLFVRVS